MPQCVVTSLLFWSMCPEFWEQPGGTEGERVERPGEFWLERVDNYNNDKGFSDLHLVQDRVSFSISNLSPSLQ